MSQLRRHSAFVLLLMMVLLMGGLFAQMSRLRAEGRVLDAPLAQLTSSLTPTGTPSTGGYGGLVWADRDGDGMQDAGEPGMEGITVQLWDADRTTVIGTAITDAEGRYTLAVPVPGSYRLRVVQPRGANAFSPADQANGDDSLDSDVDSDGPDVGYTSELPAAQDGIALIDVDAGIVEVCPPLPTLTPLPSAVSRPTRAPAPINLSGAVWVDLDDDGTHDTNEPGLSGVTVQLWDSSKTVFVSATTTDTEGRYRLDAPVRGMYRVRAQLPSGASAFSPLDWADGDDRLDSDIHPDGPDAGYTDPIRVDEDRLSITGLDVGLIITCPPPPIMTPTHLPSDTPTAVAPPSTVDLDTPAPVATSVPVDLDTPAPSDTSVPPDPDTPKPPVDVDTPTPTLTPSPTASRTPTRTPTFGPTPTRTPTPINVGNFVWDDIDQDGRQDAGEPGLAGITVQLWNSTKTLLIDSALTGATGNYTLVAPTPGQYRVRVILPGLSDSFSPKDQAGGDDQKDSDVNVGGANLGFTSIYVFASNLISISNIDAGVIVFRTPTPTRTPTPINVGNFVWDDFDQDGRQDAGEPGLAGVTVQLWNGAKTVLIDSAVTGATGTYTLIAPTPGQYRVRVILSGFSDSFSPKDQAGGDDQKDSDVNVGGVNLGFTDIYNFASNLISITTIDTGVIVFRTPTPTRTPTPINVGNFVWDDIDQDGRQDAGEPGLAGITVQLWNSTKTLMFDDAVTGISGNYTLIAPLPGQYRVRVILPGASDSFSPKDQAGGDDQKDSDVNVGGANLGFTDIYNFASNLISITTIDTGVIIYRTPTPTRTPTPINVGNLVWRDFNGDGIQNGSEPGLAGVTVQLWNSAKTLMIDDAVTGASGNYTLIAPTPGQYRVRVLLPDVADQFSPKDQGGDDQLDSDINTSGTNAGFTDVYDFPSNLISITTIDAGIIVPIVFPVQASPVQDLGLLPVLTFTPTPTATRPIVRVTPTRRAPAGVDCAGFRLTAPLDGLPNGVATFYWDPISAEGVTYQITVFDAGGGALASFGAGNQTSVSGDVSQGAIGGAFQLIVRVTAVVNGQVVCSDQRAILRAAPESGGPSDSDDDGDSPRATATRRPNSTGGQPTG